MTEQEWLASDDPARMLAWATGNHATPPHPKHLFLWKPSDRKLRLFACACVRQAWGLLTDDAPCPTCKGQRLISVDSLTGWTGCPHCGGTGRVNRSRRAVEVAERYADGLATKTELLRQRGAMTAPDLYPSSLHTAVWLATHEPLVLGEFTHAIDAEGRGCLFGTQAALLRDIVGSPWRRYLVADWAMNPQAFGFTDVFAKAWVTPTVLSLARAAYEKRPRKWNPERYASHDEETGWIEDGTLDPLRLAVLSDALEEAGCDEATILSHLRSPGPHYRGMWSLDSILNKS